jgi:hypothetical protein
LGIVGPNNYLGEKELLGKNIYRVCQARVVSSEMECFVISKKNLAIVTRWSDVVNRMKENDELKSFWHQGMFESCIKIS